MTKASLLIPARLEDFLRRRAAGEPYEELALRFGVTGEQVRSLLGKHRRRLHEFYALMGVTPPRPGGAHHKALVPPAPDAKVRRCLSCRKNFDSEGVGNQLCKTCKASEAWRSGGSLTMQLGPRRVYTGAA